MEEGWAGVWVGEEGRSQEGVAAQTAVRCRLPQPTLSGGHSPNVASSRDGMDNDTGTESLVSHRRERARRRNREEGNEAAS